MNKLILLAIAIMLAACAPARALTDDVAPITNAIYPTQLGSTLRGVEQAIAGKVGTQILMRGDNYLFVWSVKDAWAFVGVNAKGISIKNAADVFSTGNLVNAKTMKELIDGMKENGWSTIASSNLPDTIKNMFAAGASALLRQLATTNFTFLVIPANLFDFDIEVLKSVEG